MKKDVIGVEEAFCSGCGARLMKAYHTKDGAYCQGCSQGKGRKQKEGVSKK